MSSCKFFFFLNIFDIFFDNFLIFFLFLDFALFCFWSRMMLKQRMISFMFLFSSLLLSFHSRLELTTFFFPFCLVFSLSLSLFSFLFPPPSSFLLLPPPSSTFLHHTTTNYYRYASERSSVSETVSGGGTYKHHRTIDLRTARLVRDGHKSTLAFCLQSPKKSFIIICLTLEQKNKWCDAIQVKKKKFLFFLSFFSFFLSILDLLFLLLFV